jgi:hypothetical protein
MRHTHSTPARPTHKSVTLAGTPVPRASSRLRLENTLRAPGFYPHPPMSNVLPEPAGGPTLLVKSGHAFDESLFGLCRQTQAIRDKPIPGKSNPRTIRPTNALSDSFPDGGPQGSWMRLQRVRLPPRTIDCNDFPPITPPLADTSRFEPSTKSCQPSPAKSLHDSPGRLLFFRGGDSPPRHPAQGTDHPSCPRHPDPGTATSSTFWGHPPCTRRRRKSAEKKPEKPPTDLCSVLGPAYYLSTIQE